MSMVINELIFFVLSEYYSELMATFQLLHCELAWLTVSELFDAAFNYERFIGSCRKDFYILKLLRLTAVNI